MNDYSRIPKELQNVPNWGLFRLENIDSETNKKTKVPINAMTGRMASSTDTTTWTTFNEALNNLEMFHGDGLAFFFKEPYIGIDMDHYESEIADWFTKRQTENPVAEIVDFAKSYTEVSVSGTGIHVIAKGKLPGERHRKSQGDGKVIEMYSKDRFFAITGKQLGPYKEVADIDTEAFRPIYEKYLGKPVYVDTNTYTNTGKNKLVDSDVIKLALESNNGGKFKKLLEGNWQEDYSSQSEADIAFANMLAFWASKDRGVMDSIFRNSGLYRSKWDEHRGSMTYGEITISKAITDNSEVYAKNELDFDIIINDYNFEAAPDRFPIHDYTDQGVVERFTDRWGDIVLSISEWRKKGTNFMVYQNGFWQQDTNNIVHRLVLRLADIIRDEEEPQLPPEPDYKSMAKAGKDVNAEIKKYDKAVAKAEDNYWSLIKRLRSNTGTTQVEAMISKSLTASIMDFDQEVGVINTPDGIYDLTTGERTDNTPERRFTKITTIAPSKKVEPKLFLKTLNDIFEGNKELVEYFMKWIGYGLFGTGEEQEYAIMLGSGSNGKTLLINTIKNVLGDYITTSDYKTFASKSYVASGPDPATMRLRGARIVSISEFEQGVKIDAAKLKNLTGGGTFVGDEKYGDTYEFTSHGVPIIDTNYLPETTDNSDGFWRRTNVIPFNRTFTDEEKDLELEDKLRREQEGILWLIIEYATLWRRNGLKDNKPKAVIEQNEEYKRDNDPIDVFFHTVLEKTDDVHDQVKVYELRVIYNQWEKLYQGGHSNRELAFAMTRRYGIKRKKGSGGKNGSSAYQGVRLKSEAKKFNVEVPGLG